MKNQVSYSPEVRERAVRNCLEIADAIAAAFPDTQIQLCIVHMARNSVKFVSRKVLTHQYIGDKD